MDELNQEKEKLLKIPIHLAKQIMKPQARQTNIVEQNSNGEILIYDLISDKAYLLNETSAFVWKNCDGSRNVSEIAAELAKNANQQVSEDIIWLAIAQLEKDNLMAEAVNDANPLTGINRREVIRKIGLGTMIALPLVSSLIVPTAINAASGVCQPNAAGCFASGVNGSAPGGGNTGITCPQACAPFAQRCCSCTVQFAIDRRPSVQDCFCACS